MHALALNADHQPLKVIDYKRAVTLLLEGSAYLVQGYEGMTIRSQHLSLEWPAVIALYRYVDVRPRVKFTRAHVIARDRYTCQFCGDKPPLEDLTLDHVVPRAHAVKNRVMLPWSGKRVHVTCWENIATACAPCNYRKGPRTPGQAGMTLSRFPAKPTAWDCVLMPLLRQGIPSEWKEYVPVEWRDYWDGELESE